MLPCPTLQFPHVRDYYSLKQTHAEVHVSEIVASHLGISVSSLDTVHAGSLEWDPEATKRHRQG